MKIGITSVRPGQPCFVIAEAGSNHNRNLAQARELVEVAARAGADAIKFQTYSADLLYSRRTPVFPGEREQPWNIVKSCEMPREWLPELVANAMEQGIQFLSTPFDYRAVDELDAAGVSAFKWASSEINDLPLLRYAAAKGKPMLISTGMADLADIQEAVDAVRSTGNEDIILLHCVALYPTPAEQVNLLAMDTMRSAFQLPVGYSDHTLGSVVALAAVARGACVLEKHITLDRRLPGPDHHYALEPEELVDLVRNVREVEACLGYPVKKPSPGEKEKRILSRRSIIAATDIPAGTRIAGEMLVTKRPGTGIPPKFLDVVVGRTARVDIPFDTPLTWDMI